MSETYPPPPPTETRTASPPPPGDTALTGADPLAPAGLALALVIVGVAALAAARRWSRD